MIFPKFELKQLSAYIAIIVIFIHNVVINKDLECSCQETFLQCWLYFVLPALMLFFLQLWTEKKFQRATRFCCFQPTQGHFCCICWYNIFKAVFIGLLWIIYVLVDGDWYVCCHNDHSKQAQLACKDKENITAKDRTSINNLKHTSWGLGISIILLAVIVAAFMSSCGWMTCSNRKLLYYKVILDQEENVLEEILTTAAQKKLTETINTTLGNGSWENCFDVAKGLIKNSNETVLKPEVVVKEEAVRLEKLQLEVKGLKLSQKEQQQPGQQQPGQQQPGQQPGQQTEQQQPGQQPGQQQPGQQPGQQTEQQQPGQQPGQQTEQQQPGQQPGQQTEQQQTEQQQQPQVEAVRLEKLQLEVKGLKLSQKVEAVRLEKLQLQVKGLKLSQKEERIPLEKLQPEVDPLLSTSPGSSGEQ